MSGERLPSPEEIATQIQIIRDQIAELQGLAAQIESRLRSVQAAKDTIEALEKEGGGETLFPADPDLNVLVRAKPVETGKAIVLLGLNIYATLDKAKAVEVLSKKEAALKKSLESIKAEIEKLAKMHDQQLQLLQMISLQQSQARGQQGGGSGKPAG
ncbi:MAG: prefoldin subunit alpha [Aeropyrum sp.]|nr:prefoldin subunit alpha [Aeropyrum sp.]MCE4616049.1 prefoldin subunit alpha [Aeropyrum sp.]